jgi:hypothetical protein
MLDNKYRSDGVMKGWSTGVNKCGFWIVDVGIKIFNKRSGFKNFSSL